MHRGLANSGTHALVVDNATSPTFYQNEIILTLDLSNYDESCDVVHLAFQWIDINDEPQAQDRVYLRGSSSDTWIEILDWTTPNSPAWQSFAAHDVSNTLSTALPAQSFSSSFQVRWVQYDSHSTPSDGFGVDDVALTLDSTSCSGGSGITLPWTEGFEGAGPGPYQTNQDPVPNTTAWKYELTASGRLRLQAGAGYYRAGSYAATLDASPSGATSINYLIATLDLSSYDASSDSVEL